MPVSEAVKQLMHTEMLHVESFLGAVGYGTPAMQLDDTFLATAKAYGMHTTSARRAVLRGIYAETIARHNG